MGGAVIVPKIVEETLHPWGAASLELNGAQYSSSTNVSADGTWTPVGAVNIGSYPSGYVGYHGNLKEAELGVVVAFKSDNGDNIVDWKVQTRNLINANIEASWVDISASQVQTRPVNTVFYDNVISGLGEVQSNFNRLPFEVRVLYKANCANVVQARMKNSGYVRYISQIL